MPNEKIHRTYPIGTTVLTDGSGATTVTNYESRECVTVQWQPDHDVSVGVEIQSTEPGAPGYGGWMTLDRAEINRLIKALRRARDAAYGRDE